MNPTNTSVGGWRDSEMRKYVNNDIFTRYYYLGENIGEYKFFTPSGFISAMENDCLDR